MVRHSARITAALLGITLAACDQKARPAQDKAALSVASPIADEARLAPAQARSVDGVPVAGAAFGVARAAATSEATIKANAPTESQNPTFPTQDVVPGAMLVRIGQASVQVDSLEIGIARVRDIARRTGAILANTTMQGGREQVRSASLELRVPSERFDEAVNGLAPIGKLESVNVSVEDVGEEYVDVQARIANARRLEQRLVELLANRTGKLADVLTVEHELARVREQIERYEGRLRYLRSRASVSTLTVAVHEPFPVVASHPGERPIRDAFVQAWRNLVGVTAAVIASLGVVVPLGVLVVLVALIGRRLLPKNALRLSPKATGSENA